MQLYLAQQPADPLPPAPEAGGIYLPVEGLILGSGAILLGLFKWLISREFRRLESTLADYGGRLKVLEDNDAGQRVESAAVARIGEEVDRLERRVNVLDAAVAVLPRIESSVEALDGLPQKFDNVVFALTQAQDLVKDCQKDLVALRTEIAKTTVAEDKYVRDMTVLTSRVDAVWERFDSVTGGRRLLEGDYQP